MIRSLFLAMVSPRKKYLLPKDNLAVTYANSANLAKQAITKRNGMLDDSLWEQVAKGKTIIQSIQVRAFCAPVV
jgi:hypothetical protein